MNPGDVVANRFEIEAIAGSGGMGIVYRAHDRAANERVALKLLFGIGEGDAARFVREAEMLAALAHPGIVRYVAHGQTADHRHYIVMEWATGETLHQRLAKGRLGVGETLTVCKAIADAVGAAHARGVVHRDLKPGNVILVERELARVKVLDFGIARNIAGANRLTKTGMMIGTPGYMAPEQVRGDAVIDARADVFALGGIMYRCLTGTSAFAGDDMLAVLAKVIAEGVVPPSTLATMVPPPVDALVLRMLAKQASARFDDGRAVVQAIDELSDVTLRDVPSVEVVTRRDGSGVAASERTTDTIRTAITASEQRLVSIVLTGPTAVEDRERRVTIASAFGGRLEQLADGASLVLFAHADVASDHAIRAARCVLALRDSNPSAAFVVASGRASVERLITGDVIDRAVASIRGATPGEIILDDATANLLDDRFVVVDHRLESMRNSDQPLRTLLGRVTPIVGRDRELATLIGLWDECVDERVARAVLVTAAPGAGKSRVLHELLQRIAPAEALIGRADSLRAGSPFAMLAQALRRTSGIGDGDSLDDQRAALHRRVARHVPAADVDRITHLLGEITGVAFASEAGEALRAARRDPVALGDAMREAWIGWLAAECAHAPVLLILEDLHWGDRPTIDLVDAALRELATAPLLIVALARPEVHDRFPKLWEDRAMQELRLPQLTKKASERLVRELLGDEVDPAIVQRIVERAAGNAFFLEELIRAVAEGRGELLPDSVLSMLQLRLDALEPDAKRTLRAGSVFGEVFWRGGVKRLLDLDPRVHLDELVQRELVAMVPSSSIPSEIEYAFRHDLVREAAYATMNSDERVLADAIAGEWLVAHGHSDAVALASHFTRGNDPRRAAGFFARAAEQALAGNDNDAALAHVDHALTSDVELAPELVGRLELARAEALNWRGDHAAAIPAAARARERLPRGGVSWFRATSEVFFGAGRLGEMAHAMGSLRDLTTAVPLPDASLEQLRSVSRAAIIMLRFGPPGVGAALVERADALAVGSEPDLIVSHRLHTIHALVARARGDAPAAIAENNAAIDAAERVHDMRELAFTYLSGGGFYLELNSPELAEPLLARGVQHAERVGAATVLSLLYVLSSFCELERDRLDAARSYATRALAGCADSDRSAEGLARWCLARIAHLRGDLAGAERHLAVALDKLATFAEFHTFALASQAQLELAYRNPARALQTLATALAKAQPNNGFEQGESLLRLLEIEALEQLDDPRAAEATRIAIARLDERAARIAEPWRTRFLSRAENAATLERR
ncbi:MAG: protein kinase [Kofleriaceae bacterium]